MSDTTDAARTRTVSWTDPMAALQMAFTMTREEFVAAFASDAFPRPPIAELLGFRGVEAEAGRIVMELELGEHLCNGMGIVAAGVTATVLDAAMWAAVQTAAPENTIASTTNVNLHLIRQLPITIGTVRAEATAVHVGRSTGTAEARLVDADGKLYAHATSGLVCIAPGS